MTLAKPLAQYYRKPKCKRCGSELRVDRYRNGGREAKANNCNCGRYHFQHRKGSYFCEFGIAGSQGWTFFDRNTAPFIEWTQEQR